MSILGLGWALVPHRAGETRGCHAGIVHSKQVGTSAGCWTICLSNICLNVTLCSCEKGKKNQSRVLSGKSDGTSGKKLLATVWVSRSLIRFRHECLTQLKRDHFQPQCSNLSLCESCLCKEEKASAAESRAESLSLHGHTVTQIWGQHSSIPRHPILWD